MKINILNIDTNKGYADKLRLCFWLYLFFVIFEGAFRKWILPELSSLFLVIRDPIAIYVLFTGIYHKKLTNGFGIFFLVISYISFITTLMWGHQNFIVALYGARVYALHIPILFIWSNILTREDLLQIGKWILLLSILMCIIIGLQYLTPQSSWINRGIGGDTEGSGFSGVGDYFRPSGTFSFVTGMIGFEFLVASYLFFYWQSNTILSKKQKIPPQYLYIYLLIFLISIFFCLSRSVIASTAIVFFTTILSSFLAQTKTYKTITLIVLITLLFIILYSFIPFFQLAVDNMFLRFDAASNSEGNFIKGSIGERFGGAFLRAFTDTQNFTGKEIPFWGFGMGTGSKVGSTLLGLSFLNSFGVAEEEWSLVICEYGYLIGAILLLVGRTYFPIYYAIKAAQILIHKKDFLPFIFTPFFIISFLTYQLSVPTILGFTTIAGSLFFAAIKTSSSK